MANPRQPLRLSQKDTIFWGWNQSSSLSPKNYFLTLQNMTLQISSTLTLMRLFTLIPMVVLDFPQVPRFVGKLILFISVLKPFPRKVDLF